MCARKSRLLNPGSQLPAQRLHHPPCSGHQWLVSIAYEDWLGNSVSINAHDCCTQTAHCLPNNKMTDKCAHLCFGRAIPSKISDDMCTNKNCADAAASRNRITRLAMLNSCGCAATATLTWHLTGRHAYLWCLLFTPTAATMPATSPPGSPGSLPGYIPRTFSTSLKLSPIAPHCQQDLHMSAAGLQHSPDCLCIRLPGYRCTLRLRLILAKLNS